jgi:hypothetical protein
MGWYPSYQSGFIKSQSPQFSISYIYIGKINQFLNEILRVLNNVNTNCLELFSPPPLCPEKDEKDENPPLHPALGSGKTKAHKCP